MCYSFRVTVPLHLVHDVPSSDMLSGFRITSDMVSGFRITSDMVSKTSKVIVSPSVVVVYLYFDSERKKGEHVRYHQLFVAKYYIQRKK